MKSTVFLSLLLCVLFANCEYNLEDETVFTEIEAPSPSDLEYIVFADSLDSIYVYNEELILFDTDFNDLELLDIFLSIDDQRYEVDTLDGQIFFHLDPSLFGSGEHTFVLKGFVSTGAYSLASMLEAEYYELTKEFKVFIDLIPPASISIDTIYLEDGTLNILWDAPKKINYTYLELISRIYVPNGDPARFYRDVGLNEPLDKSTVSFQDFGYAGMEIAYGVNIVGYNFEVTGELKDFNMDPLADVIAEYRDDGTIYVEWSNMSLYNNDLQFKINDGANRLQYITLAESGTFQRNFEIEFGNFDYFSLELRSNDRDNYYNVGVSHSERFVFFPGDRFPYYRELKKAVGTNKIYTLGAGTSKIYRFDSELLTLEDSSNYTIPEQSGQNQLYLTRDGNFLYYKFEEFFYEIDPISFELINTIDLSEITGQYSKRINSTSIGTNQFLSFTMSGTQYVIDLKNQEIISQLPTLGTLRARLSPDGQQYVYGNDLYELDGNEWILLGSILDPSFDPEVTNQITVLGFTSDGSQIIYWHYGNKTTYVFDVEMMDVVASFESATRWSLDIFSDQLFTSSFGEPNYGDGTLSIYDLDGTLVRTVDIYHNHYGWYYSLSGNRVFSSRGLVYEF